MKYKICAALKEDINTGWVWVTTDGDFRQRSVVCINNPQTKKKVFCEVLQIDKNFLKHYNAEGEKRQEINEGDSVIVMNEWYRSLLGDLKTNSEYELEVSSSQDMKGWLFACAHHPQIIVRVAYWLALLSVTLGMAGLIFGIASLVK